MTTQTIQDAQKMQEAIRLKFTYRYTDRPILNGEKESVAAHSWGLMIILDYLLDVLDQKVPGKYPIDKAKLYSIAIYHDLIEAETGDIDLGPGYGKPHETKHIGEAEAMKSFPEKLPSSIRNRFLETHAEYEQRESLESKLVKIADILDCDFMLHDKPSFYANMTREYYIQKKLPHFAPFPELVYIFDDFFENLDALDAFGKTNKQ